MRNSTIFGKSLRTVVIFPKMLRRPGLDIRSVDGTAKHSSSKPLDSTIGAGLTITAFRIPKRCMRPNDSQMYTKPWSVTLHFRLMPDTEFLEDICDNERDSSHAVGR